MSTSSHTMSFQTRENVFFENFLTIKTFFFYNREIENQLTIPPLFFRNFAGSGVQLAGFLLIESL